MGKTRRTKPAGKVERNKDGTSSAVTILAMADRPDSAGRTYSSEVLEKIAAQSDQYQYDPNLNALLVRVTGPYPYVNVENLAADAAVPPNELPKDLRETLVREQNNLALDTNACHLGKTVPYTKVWMFLCRLLESRELPAQDLIGALHYATMGSGDEIISMSGGAAEAHKLMQTYFWTKEEWDT